MSKVDQKRNWVKLKSVQTKVANEVICGHYIPCEKLTKSENVSS